MGVDVTFRIGGEAGQGLQMISYVLGKTFAREGYHAFVTQDVMSRIRGGHNLADVRICDQPVSAQSDRCNILIALDERTVSEHRDKVPKDGVIIRDSGENPQSAIPNPQSAIQRPPRPLTPGPQSLSIPLTEIAKRTGGDVRMANSVALGALLSITGYTIEPLLEVLRNLFANKGPEIVKRNLDCARAGFSFAPDSFKKACPCTIPALHSAAPKLFMSGAEAVGLSAILSGLQFYAGYPMSPSTRIMEYVLDKARESGIIVEQSEDEISAVNMAIGASVAGARSMTASSGGGLSLMVEGLSLAGMTETPVVIALCSRPGPATGLATRQAQADLLFAIHAGHGEFNRVVLAPGDADQVLELTSRAFDLAEKYQVPAILLLDQHLNESYWSIERIDETKFLRARYFADAAHMPPYSYKRYAGEIRNMQSAIRNPNVSPLIRPGTRNQVRYDDSDEHTEEGHITETAEGRRAMVAKRLGKAKHIAAELPVPEIERRATNDERRTTNYVLCFGSTRGAVLEAAARLRAKGASLDVMHFSALWPFPRESVLARLSRAKKIITVEGNATAQLARLVATETRIKPHDSILRYDGRPFTVEQVEQEIEKRL